VCGCPQDRDFFHAPGDDGIDYRLGQCTECDLVYTNPRPDQASIARFYPDDYSPYQPPKRRRTGYLRALRTRIGLFREKSLSDRIPVRPGAVLMDYGCGSGWFAARMRDRGWNALGMDFSPHAVHAAKANFDLRVIQGTLPHPAVPNDSLDALTLRAVLEHVHRPCELLDAAYHALRPGGWLYLSVPNLSSWGFQAFGRSWFPLDPPRHLLHFTPATLRQTVEKSGFEVSDSTTRGHAKWLLYSVQRALKSDARTIRFSRYGLVRSLIARWTQWTNRADDLALLARKPLAAPPIRRAA
jgi:SAM-dependent methyltransferase